MSNLILIPKITPPESFLVSEIETLVTNIEQGKLTRKEIVYVAICVDYAAQMGVKRELGSSGWKHLETAVRVKDSPSGTD